MFENPRWRRPPSWKITKIAISPQRFDRSLRNLVRWCKMGLLSAPTVRKFEFHKSKMADGRHCENRWITIYLQPFGRFWLNLARWCTLVPSAWGKVQIFNFRQSLYGRLPLSSESKNCLSLNILCNYTMTHYTILTIKQQILILKTAVCP